MKLFALFVFITVFHTISTGKTRRPFTLKTQMKVKDIDPSEMKFIQVSTKDGQPVGIIVKRRERTQKSNNKRKPKEISEEVQEIIGVRVPDSPDDLHHVYRNAKIVDNKLMTRKSSQFDEVEGSFRVNGE
jgi:hypothetical protein